MSPNGRFSQREGEIIRKEERQINETKGSSIYADLWWRFAAGAQFHIEKCAREEFGLTKRARCLWWRELIAFEQQQEHSNWEEWHCKIAMVNGNNIGKIKDHTDISFSLCCLIFLFAPDGLLWSIDGCWSSSGTEIPRDCCNNDILIFSFSKIKPP